MGINPKIKIVKRGKLSRINEIKLVKMKTRQVPFHSFRPKILFAALPYSYDIHAVFETLRGTDSRRSLKVVRAYI